MIRAVIFDFDGTIADTISAIREGVNMTMRQYGYPEHTYDEVQSFINNGARQLVLRAMPEDLRSDEALWDRVFETYEESYGQTYMQTKEAYDGLPELIQKLHDTDGFKIGVLSNKEDLFVRNLTHQVLFPNTFDAVQGVVPGHPTKPHPYLGNRIAESLGVKPEECIMIGDSDVDFRTAQNAGMAHIGVSWGYRDEAFLRDHGVTRIAHSAAELKDMIGKRP
jgi:phosphoglycolate phosphatase